MANEVIPWWTLTKAQQKAEIEAAVEEFIELDRGLTERERFFLAQALGNVARGLFGVALQDIIDAHEPDNAFSSSFTIPAIQIEGVTKETLRRVLRRSVDTPVQEREIFFR